MISKDAYKALPEAVKKRIDPYIEATSTLTQIRNPRVMASLAPSGVRGLILQRGKQGVASLAPAHHSAYFDWGYNRGYGEMSDLYERAKEQQWNGSDLHWSTDVDPLRPETALLPHDFIPIDKVPELKLSEGDTRRLSADVGAWVLSQFLHGEQGALFATAQVTEAVHSFDGKLYGATQVMDEARHVEVFHRYLDTKLNKLYQINDNLFVIIDALMRDGRWDMKFLGMQIMVEGLALGAFGSMYRMTREPLLKELLKYVILDEARHVHFGVLSLREHIRTELSDSERREREDWAFEVAVLMRDRFLVREIWEEWFEGTTVTWERWKQLLTTAPAFEEFRNVMFRRLVPNLREIGLLSDRIKPHYDRVGLLKYFGELAAPEISGEQMIADLDAAGSPAAWYEPAAE